MKTYANKSFEKDKKDLIHVALSLQGKLNDAFFYAKKQQTSMQGNCLALNVLDIEDISSQINVDIYEKRVINIF